MLPTRRDSGRPSRASPPRMPLPKLSPSSVGHRSGSPNVRGRILTNPSIPALGNGSDRGCTFSLAPVEGSSSSDCEGDAWLAHAAAQGQWHHPHGSSCCVRVQRGLDTWEASAAASPPGQSGQIAPSATGRASRRWGPAAPARASSRLPPRCPRGTRHPLTQRRAVMPGCPSHLTGRMAPSPAAAARARPNVASSHLGGFGGSLPAPSWDRSLPLPQAGPASQRWVHGRAHPSTGGSPPGPHRACLPRPASGYGARLPIDNIGRGVVRAPAGQCLSGPGCRACIYWRGLMAPPPCGSVSGHAHVTGLGVWGPLPAAPWQRMHARAVAPPPPGGDMPCAYRACYRLYDDTAFHRVWGPGCPRHHAGGIAPPPRQQLRPRCGHHWTATGALTRSPLAP